MKLPLNHFSMVSLNIREVQNVNPGKRKKNGLMLWYYFEGRSAAKSRQWRGDQY